MADHYFKLVNRRNLELGGITNVISFDEQEILLETVMGFLNITGEELHITILKLDEGKVTLEGNVNGLEYKVQGPDIKTKGKNILNRLLK